MPLAVDGFGADERLDERHRVVGERFLGERDLADAGVDDARLLDAVLDLAGLGLLDGVRRRRT